MKALICSTPGEFEYRTLDYPERKQGHTLLRIRRIGVCGTDLHAFEGTQPYFEYPRILGHELAAEVIETDRPDFSTGERVTFIPYFSCGHCIACRKGKTNCCTDIKVFGVHIDGGMAEYVSVPSEALLHGDGLTFEELALIEPLAIGAHGIRRAAVESGEFVLVIGAGPIGLGVMEFARIAGGNVIAMDVNENRLRFCAEELGVKHIIHPMKESVEERLKEITNGDMPTVIVDATGNQKAINEAFGYLAHGGRFVLVGLQKQEIRFSHPEFHARESTLMSSRNATREDFEKVISSVKNQWIDPRKLITHQVPFDRVREEFPKWSDPKNKVIKAMIEIP